MKKVISFSLWGHNPKYTQGAIENIKLSKKIYPEWTCRFYIGDIPQNIYDIMKNEENVEIINMSQSGDWTSMFWRFYPASESNVDIFIVRDTDSRLSMREKYAVDEWISSDKGLHIMRDHPFHNSLIMGGMWGMKKNTFPNMITEIKNYNKGNFWQIDQNFLNQVVYPSCSGNIFVHDEFFNFESHRKNFPTKRLDKEFVGDVFDDKNIRHPEYYKKI